MDLSAVIGTGFNGCAMVSAKGVTVFEKAYGYADLPNKIPNERGTRFATASAGKVFVAVGILRLIERGFLTLDAKIGDILEFDLNRIDPAVTVEELLTHTSGIPDYFDESIMEDYEALWADFPNYRIRSNSDLLPLFINKPMTNERGAKFQYNNAGFVLLALIMEKLTGMPFDRYLAQNVFEPCGMAHTGYYELDRLPAKCAVNYIFDPYQQNYRTNIYSVDVKGTGAGGAFTTLGDVKAFWENLMSCKLLSEEMTCAMLENHSGQAQCYGYGIWLAKAGAAKVAYFQGSDPGVSFVSCYHLQKKLLLTLISNFADDVWKLQSDLVEYLKW